MKNLLYKEFKLAAHPTTFIFLAFGAMLLIPSYPYSVAFFYTTLGIFFTFISGRENNDIFYSALLPVAKKDIVKARCLFIAIIEVLQIIIAVPFAIIGTLINPNEGGNVAGMDANVAFFGCVFVLFAIFNAVFIPGFYKTAYKIGKPFLFATVFVFLFICCMEISSHIPKIAAYIDSTDAAMQIRQLPILAVGILIYVLSMWLTYVESASRFEKVDL